jgi:hypothetical protein
MTYNNYTNRRETPSRVAGEQSRTVETTAQPGDMVGSWL